MPHTAHTDEVSLSVPVYDPTIGVVALSDPRADPGAHVHLDPGTEPLDFGSAPLMVARDPQSEAGELHRDG